MSTEGEGKQDMAKLQERLRQIIVIPVQPAHSLRCIQCDDVFSWEGLPDHLKLHHPDLWANLMKSFEHMSRQGYPIGEILINYNLPFHRKQISRALQERRKKL